MAALRCLQPRRRCWCCTAPAARRARRSPSPAPLICRKARRQNAAGRWSRLPTAQPAPPTFAPPHGPPLAAPADGYIAYASASYDSWLKAGYAVLRTDYEGLGTPGRHPYLIGASEGRGVVDIALAARNLFGNSLLSKAWAIGGHSQGGHAALFAASLAPKLAPGLSLKGVFAYAPASHIYEQRLAIASLGDAFKGLTGLAALILYSAAQEAGVDPATLVQPNIAALLGQIEKVCTAQLGSKAIFGDIAPNAILKPGIKTDSVDKVLMAMNPDVKISVPGINPPGQVRHDGLLWLHRRAGQGARQARRQGDLHQVRRVESLECRHRRRTAGRSSGVPASPPRFVAPGSREPRIRLQSRPRRQPPRRRRGEPLQPGHDRSRRAPVPPSRSARAIQRGRGDGQ